ncbi:putative p-glycoprotein e [Leishmania mexicana MHOM/GT/2001/U1103]|uniref:p-glycoprotein e n=1 Tax=Leishmania mexicana (strain MHOM/GT/2001/U1103) TaxID=929439 RepID=E9B1S6_LEIMU|nr:putative p-glycoprotein e [Leishmania mexicana MHOM/GT/2001/U1103]CBZ29183.1 putative p-glycoprotein e [Leishmania mexicana MHOM/GT/2001/U1103]
MDALYGAEPAYEQQPEDRAGWLLGTFFHTWLGDLMHRAAREELTMNGLPHPMREYRAYNAGVVLAAELQRQQARRHAWDGYVGARVGVRWDDASDGVLRWVGAVQQYGTPGRLYAGVEWRVAPSRRRGCCVGRCVGWLLRRGRSAPVPERGPGAYHRGEVDGEHLFDPVEDDTVLTCERVEDVIFWRDEPGGEPQEAAITREDSVDDSDINSPVQSEQSCVEVRAPPTCMSVTVALLRVLRWQLLLLGPLRLIVEVSALVTPMALSWYIRLLQGDTDTSSSDSTSSGATSAATSSSQSSSFVDSGSMMDASWQPVASVFLLFAISLVRSLALQKYAQVASRSAYAVRSGLSSCITAKSLRIASRELRRPELNPGRIVNLITTDVSSLEGAINVLWMAVTVPLQLCASVYMLYRSIGWAAGISILALLLFSPIQVFLTKKTYTSTVDLAKSSDARLRTTNEFLSGIRSIKLMTLEDTFEEEINARRAAELRAVRRFQIVSIANSLISHCVPSCTTAAVMVAYYCKGYPMSPDIIYPALSLLSLLDTPFEFITTLVGEYSQFFVSMKRLTSFLAADDAQARDILEEALASKEGDDAAAVLCNATVSSHKAVPLPPVSSRESGGGDTHYELRAKSLLADVDLRVPRGRLTVVLGPTGSGKSTLLDALIGALAVTRGRVACSRSVAYVPQQPWIMNATLRDNVVFFGAPDAAAFERAVRSTQLASDLALLADGAETEIGERGINLSGGQKARVGLARAVYADRDVYVLDDPLSALDAQVGERVMRECVCGALAGKTRVLATHQVGAAAYADLVVLLEEGRVAFQGSYAAYCEYARVHYERSVSGIGKASEYAAHTVSELASAVDLLKLEDVLDESVVPQRPLTAPTLASSGGVLLAAGPPAHGALGDAVTEDSPDVTVVESGEEKARGAVPWEVYRRYIEAGGGWLTLWSILLFFLLTEGVARWGDVWLSLWSGGMLESLSTHLRLSLYVTAVLVAILVTPFRELWCFAITRRASYHLHAGLLRSLARARLSFFDVTPRGRLINRLSRDMSLIDWDLSVSVDILLFYFFYLVAYFAIMTTSQPFVLVVLVPCILVYGRIFRFFCAANREMQRLLNISNSPVFSILNEVLTGRWTICTYGREQDMMREVLRRLDGVFACAYMQCMGNRWLLVRVELLGNLAVSGLALLGVLSMKLPWIHINLGLLALSITKASSITMVLSRFISIGASAEADMNCVERVLYYTDNAPAEDMCGAESAVKACSSTALSVAVDDGESAAAAPAGSLVLEHVDMRYRPGLPLVLRDVCFAVAPGQKVGVVGRTGSGKSTLLLAFLRLVEVCGGRMLVCGRDARDYGVRELRGLFSMIPQDPLLFDGTVRSNVDPFGRCGDAGVWRALRQVGMEERVRGDAGGLDGRVQEGGANYSVGQRQLLCLARALLKRGSAFLLMDEATANVDPALDRQIQRTVQHTFRDYTVVTIAHRLHTVAACDVIVVMDQGRVLEFGSPRELVERQGSAFSALVGSLSKGAQQAFRLAVAGGGLISCQCSAA